MKRILCTFIPLLFLCGCININVTEKETAVPVSGQAKTGTAAAETDQKTEADQKTETDQKTGTNQKTEADQKAESNQKTESNQNSEPEDTVGSANASVKPVSDLPADFTSVNIKIGTGSLHIRYGDEFSFVYDDGGSVPCEVEDDTLVCEEAFAKREGTLILPEGLQLENLNLEMEAGHLFLDGTCETENLSLSLAGGEADLHRIQVADTSDIQVRAGSVYVNGRLGGQVTVDCDMGHVNFDLQDPFDSYNYNISVSMGNLILDGEHYSGMASKSIDQGAEWEMSLSCSKGSMEIGMK